MSQLKRSVTAHEGTASERPTRSTSSGFGTLSKQKNDVLASSASVWSLTSFSPASCEARRERELGTIGRSPMVVKTIASSVSVRKVAACVPGRIWMVDACGPASQNVIAARAAVGGKSRTPINSRNLM